MTQFKVLVVDDSRFVCEALSVALGKAGFHVMIARDLSDIERETSTLPDLVLMDVVLEEAYGDELAGLLRATRGLTCPIWLMSSLPDDELAQRVEDAGLEGYVSKRAGIAPIVARVRELAGRGGGSSIEPPSSFAISARQRIRKVLAISGVRESWNAPALAGEMRALLGDAQLAGASEVADLARGAHDLVRASGAEGWTAPIRAAIDAVAASLGEPTTTRAKLLVVDDRGRLETPLLAALDHAGFTVVEARGMAEARQKLHATAYDVIVVDPRLASVDEIRSQAAGAKLVVIAGEAPPHPLADSSLFPGTPAAKVVSQLEGLLGSR
jgi:DNA-binding response OmpR family regulator